MQGPIQVLHSALLENRIAVLHKIHFYVSYLAERIIVLLVHWEGVPK